MRRSVTIAIRARGCNAAFTNVQRPKCTIKDVEVKKQQRVDLRRLPILGHITRKSTKATVDSHKQMRVCRYLGYIINRASEDGHRSTHEHAHVENVITVIQKMTFDRDQPPIMTICSTYASSDVPMSTTYIRLNISSVRGSIYDIMNRSANHDNRYNPDHNDMQHR